MFLVDDAAHRIPRVQFRVTPHPGGAQLRLEACLRAEGLGLGAAAGHPRERAPARQPALAGPMDQEWLEAGAKSSEATSLPIPLPATGRSRGRLPPGSGRGGASTPRWARRVTTGLARSPIR